MHGRPSPSTKHFFAISCFCPRERTRRKRQKGQKIDRIWFNRSSQNLECEKSWRKKTFKFDSLVHLEPERLYVQIPRGNERERECFSNKEHAFNDDDDIILS